MKIRMKMNNMIIEIKEKGDNCYEDYIKRWFL